MEIERKKLEEQAKLEEARQEIEVKKREMEAESKRIEEDRKKLEEQKKLEEERIKREQLEKENKVKGLRSVWKYEITDEDKIPREYCSSDSKKINEAIKKGITKIEGINIYQSKDIR
jgi:colicin import membrane protein